MTTTPLSASQPPPPPPLPPRSEQPSGTATRWGGVTAVAGLEIRRRLRAGRWRLLLVVWFLVLLVVTALVRANVDINDSFDDEELDRGPAMFGVLMLLVLGLSLLIVPSLTSASVNGDRDRGVLATLQVSRLSAAEIAFGKFLAAWGAAMVFLAVTLPLVVWCMVEGGTPLGRVVVSLVVVALLLGVVAALGLALSALLARTTTSAVLSYLTVFTLMAGTLLVFGLATAATREETTRTYRVPVRDPQTREIVSYRERSYTSDRVRPDRTWWLLAPNPFVVLTDAAPALPEPRRVPGEDYVPDQIDPLGEISKSVRELRLPPDDDDRIAGTATYDDSDEPEDGRGPLVWPTGLAVNLVLAAGALWVTVRKLRTPSRKLPRGQRVA